MIYAGCNTLCLFFACKPVKSYRLSAWQHFQLPLSSSDFNSDTLRYWPWPHSLALLHMAIIYASLELHAHPLWTVVPRSVHVLLPALGGKNNINKNIERSIIARSRWCRVCTRGPSIRPHNGATKHGS